MAIINTTPDSFYSGSRYGAETEILKAAETALKEGATFLDVGGQSTRPGSSRVTADEEAQRVLPAIKSIAKHFPEALISIDTYYAEVAKAAIERGACLVNDVSAGTIDKNLIPTVASLQVPYVLMHLQGSLETMQKAPAYQNVVLDVFDFFSFKLKELSDAGINDVVADIGFGFGKTAAHNFQLLKELAYFKQLGKPVLVGLSRKGTIYKTLGITPEEALNGTTVLHTVALLNGASLLRVHDVKPALEAVKLVQQLQ